MKSVLGMLVLCFFMYGGFGAIMGQITAEVNKSLFAHINNHIERVNR